MIYRLLLLLSLIWAFPIESQAQRKRDKKQEAAKQTPETGAEKDKENHDRKLGEYQNTHKHHQDIQDEATRKRMKKNLKKAERHSWGKSVPWYKRWFKRKKF